jgi:hypothetical protein
MIDIVERLRTRNGRPDGFGLGLLCDEAAGEIERLRKLNKAIAGAIERVKVSVPTDTTEQDIAAHVRRAVVAEREACAKVCERVNAGNEYRNSPLGCAKAIRQGYVAI